MGVYELLSSKEDARKGSPLCEFNGFLEDYLESANVSEKDFKILNDLFEMDKDLKIIVKLQMSISKESISNQIIRYKDIFKLEDRAVIIPYVIYGKKGDNEKALLLVDGDYIYAKGMYYSLTEPGSEFQSVKNDIVAMDLNDEELVRSTLAVLFTKRAGQIQRDLDRRHFSNYDEAYAHALELSENVRRDLHLNLAHIDDSDKEELIRSVISRWFLIKKFAYVQFMVDKNILNSRFTGNVKAQRNQAKQNADNIRFISISDLWRGKIEDDKTVVETIDNEVIDEEDDHEVLAQEAQDAQEVIESVDEGVDELNQA